MRGENDARKAGVKDLARRKNARTGGRFFPLAKLITSAESRCLFPLAIYGEGGGDRPGERSHGLGSEVQIEKKSLPKKTS